MVSNLRLPRVVRVDRVMGQKKANLRDGERTRERTNPADDGRTRNQRA